MIHPILDAAMALLWIGSIAGCYVVAFLMRPGRDADSEGKNGQNGALGEARPTGEAEGGTDDQRV